MDNTTTPNIPSPSSSTTTTYPAASKPKPAKKKVLLMGKSGSGKSSMRSIIFSNFVASDVRRLGATIDVEHSQIKFLGNLILNLWDCGGQDAFTETYLTTQRASLFREVGVLIYVFDIESRSLMHAPGGGAGGGEGGTGGAGSGGASGGEGPDMATYTNVVAALEQYSPQAHLFVLLHKMDLILPDAREALIRDRARSIRERSGHWARPTGAKGQGGGGLAVYGTSIWDQSLYEAWGDIVRKLIPDLEVLRKGLTRVGEGVRAEECVLFERATFLTVVRVVGERGARNPYDDRVEKLSNLVKTFKHSLLTYTNTPTVSHPFNEFVIAAPRFNLVLSRLTNNTYVLVVLPPGEINMAATRHNICVAREGMGRDGFGAAVGGVVEGEGGGRKEIEG